MLTAFYGPQQGVTVTSAADPGVTRTFADLTAVADEAGLSRIWAGQHTRLDHEAGRQLGGQVGGAVLDDLQVHRAEADPARPSLAGAAAACNPAAYLTGRHGVERPAGYGPCKGRRRPTVPPGGARCRCRTARARSATWRPR